MPPASTLYTRVAPAPAQQQQQYSNPQLQQLQQRYATAAAPGGAGGYDGQGAFAAPAQAPGSQAIQSGYGLGAYRSGLGGVPMTVGSALSPLQSLAPNSQWSTAARAGQGAAAGAGQGQFQAAGMWPVTKELSSGGKPMGAVDDLSALLKLTSQVGAWMRTAITWRVFERLTKTGPWEQPAQFGSALVAL
jgi:hypothetical protein